MKLRAAPLCRPKGRGLYVTRYMVPTLFPQADLNWVHIAFSVADVYNRAGLGIVAYLAAAKLMEEAVPKEVVLAGRTVN